MIPQDDATDQIILLHEIGTPPHAVPEEEFGYVGAVALSPDGDTYVLDSMAGAIRRFDAQGNFLNSIGRRGEGPGEFVNPFALAFADGKLEVWDARLWRTTGFTPVGEVVSSGRVEVRPESGWLPSVARVADGSWLYLDQEIEAPRDPGVVTAGGRIRGTARLQRWLPAEARWEEVGAFPGMEAALISEDGGLSLSNAPFPAAPVWAPADSASYWYADNQSYDIARITFASDTLARVRADVQGVPVTDSAWNAFVGGSSGDMSTPAARRRAQVERPSAMPVLRRLATSSEGDLWAAVHSQQPDSTEWHVYTADARPRYRLRLPATARIAAIGHNRLALVVRDLLDVQRVAVYSLP